MRDSDVGRQISRLLVLELKATSRETAVREIVEDIVSNQLMDKWLTAEAIHGILSRETRGSTGIGLGLALPHTRIPIRHSIVRFARSRAGVEWGALDGEPIHIVFLRLFALWRYGEECRIDEHITRVLKSDSAYPVLLEGNLSAIVELFDESDL